MRQKGPNRRYQILDVFRAAHDLRLHKNKDGDADADAISRTDILEHLKAEDAEERLLGDLDVLLRTVNYEAAVEKKDVNGTVDFGPRTSTSILNFGVPDISSLTQSDTAVDALKGRIEAALRAHEPRLRDVEVIPRKINETTEALVEFEISARLGHNPYDIPVDLLAEVDIGMGVIRSKDRR